MAKVAPDPPHSEFTLWGFNGAYYYFGLSYRWDVSP